MRQVTLAEVPDMLATELADPANAGPATDEERANAETLQHMLAAIADGRFGELRAYFTPEVTLEIAAPAHLPWVRRAEGADAVAEAVAHNFSTVREQMPHPLALVARGDTVMIMARETGRLADSGEAYDVLLAQQFTFRDGRLAVFRSTAADAAGAAEPAVA